jgi:hypothetical protein
MKQIDFKDLYEQVCAQLDVANAEIVKLKEGNGDWAHGYGLLMREYHELRKAAEKAVFTDSTMSHKELIEALENVRDE